MAAQTPYRDRPFRRTLIAVSAAVGVHLVVFGVAAWFFKDYISEIGAPAGSARITQRSLEEAVTEAPLVSAGFAGMQGEVDPAYTMEQVSFSSGWDDARFFSASEVQLPLASTWLADRSMMNAMPAPEQIWKKSQTR